MKKLKKSIAFIVSISMIATLSACGESLPEGMSQELYDTGVNALKIMDKYNDADINAEEAESRLESLHDKIDNMDLSDSESVQAHLIQSDITLFNSRIVLSSDTYTIADELRERLELD